MDTNCSYSHICSFIIFTWYFIQQLYLYFCINALHRRHIISGDVSLFGGRNPSEGFSEPPITSTLLQASKISLMLKLRSKHTQQHNFWNHFHTDKWSWWQLADTVSLFKVWQYLSVFIIQLILIRCSTPQAESSSKDNHSHLSPHFYTHW